MTLCRRGRFGRFRFRHRHRLWCLCVCGVTTRFANDDAFRRTTRRFFRRRERFRRLLVRRAARLGVVQETARLEIEGVHVEALETLETLRDAGDFSGTFRGRRGVLRSRNVRRPRRRTSRRFEETRQTRLVRRIDARFLGLVRGGARRRERLGVLLLRAFYFALARVELFLLRPLLRLHGARLPPRGVLFGVGVAFSALSLLLLVRGGDNLELCPLVRRLVLSLRLVKRLDLFVVVGAPRAVLRGEADLRVRVPPRARGGEAPNLRVHAARVARDAAERRALERTVRRPGAARQPRPRG